MDELLRKIPKIDLILREKEYLSIEKRYPKDLSRKTLREVIDEIRESLRRGEANEVPDLMEIVKRVQNRLRTKASAKLRRVINGTGIIIHTNLGRSLLPDKALEAIKEVSSFYSNLEYDLSKGERGERYMHLTDLVRRILDTEDVLVVNNNAAAVLLILNTLSDGKEVIISRGELIEIGGSFRMPDVMVKSGAILREVGTTNRTYIEDYEKAINEKTGLLMKVHTSNYKIKGFTHEIKSDELISLGKRYNLPTYFDAGSGLLFPIKDIKAEEPVIKEEIKKGFDLISFSGDKLLGGPQAGIIVGKESFIRMLKKNPLLRALRPDKLTLSALEATFSLYEDFERSFREIPTFRMIYESERNLKRRAKRLSKILQERINHASFFLLPLESEIGGGSFPDFKLSSFGIGIVPKNISLNEFEENLRKSEIPVIGRIEKDRFIIDLRTVLKEDEPHLLSSIENALKG